MTDAEYRRMKRLEAQDKSLGSAAMGWRDRDDRFDRYKREEEARANGEPVDDADAPAVDLSTYQEQPLSKDAKRRLDQFEKTGMRFTPTDRMKMVMRGVKLLDKPVLDSRDKTLLSYYLGLAFDEEKEARESRSHGMDDEDLDAILVAADAAYNAEKAGHTEEAMQLMERLSSTHRYRVMKREVQTGTIAQKVEAEMKAERVLEASCATDAAKAPVG